MRHASSSHWHHLLVTLLTTFNLASRNDPVRLATPSHWHQQDKTLLVGLLPRLILWDGLLSRNQQKMRA